MTTRLVEGGHPLEGQVKPSGSKDSSIKLIIASLFSNEDVILDNVPRTYNINILYDAIKAIGGNISWIGDNKLLINASTVQTYEIPFEIGSKSRSVLLMAGPLLFRFRKASLPKPVNSRTKHNPINRWITTWEALGITVEDSDNYILLSAENIKEANIGFKINTHTGTANAILSSVFISGETIINNAAEETEVDDLIEFLNKIGASIERTEPRRIKIEGRSVFNGTFYEIMPDNIEAVAYAIAALVTKGNISIKGIKRLQLTSFVNFLTKIGARYEYGRDELNVWYGGEEFTATTIESSPSPGFLTDWLPFAALLLNFANGVSRVHDTIYVDRLTFVQDLNRMGADIELKKPTEAGLMAVISDESYDYNVYGEPKTVAQITGPRKLRGERLNMTDSRFDPVLIIAALSADGKSELVDADEMVVRYERFFDKLISLGAHIS